MKLLPKRSPSRAKKSQKGTFGKLQIPDPHFKVRRTCGYVLTTTLPLFRIRFGLGWVVGVGELRSEGGKVGEAQVKFYVAEVREGRSEGGGER